MNAPREVLTEVKDAVERTVDHEVEAYSGGEERPLRNYGAFMATYAAVVGALVLLGRHRKVRLPEHVSFGDLALLGVATHRVSRLVSKDSITSVVRAPFTRYVEPAGAGEVNEEVRGSGLRHAAGELLACPFCLAQWIGTGFVAGFVFAPRATRIVASAFTVVAASDALQFVYAGLRKVEQ